MRLSIKFSISISKNEKHEIKDEPQFEHRDVHSERELAEQTRIVFTIPSSAESYYPDEDLARRERLGAEFDQLVRGER